MLGTFSIRKGVVKVSDKELLQMLEMSLLEQKGVCACCSLPISESVGVAFVDSNQENTTKENIKAVCKACEALHNGGKLADNEPCGFLIYLPNMPQIEVIKLAYAAKGLLINEGSASIVYAITKLNDEIRLLKKPVAAYLGFDDTTVLSDFLKTLNESGYSRRAEGLGAVRWWPDLEIASLRKHAVNYKSGLLSKETLENMASI